MLHLNRLEVVNWRQNLDSKGLIRKILENKDLRADSRKGPVRRLEGELNTFLLLFYQPSAERFSVLRLVCS